MLSDMGFMESGNTEQYSSTGSSHSWQDEYFSRSIEQNKHSDNRMVFKQGNSRHYFVSGVILLFVFGRFTSFGKYGSLMG
jgi:hypothetical protein